MKQWQTLALIMAGVIGALWFSGRLNEQSAVPSYTMTTRKRRRRYRLSPSTWEVLRCRYIPHSQFRRINPRVQVTTIINERMELLQSDSIGLSRLLAQGQANGWSDYETIYREAIQTLLADRSIEQASEDLCEVEETPSEPDEELPPGEV